MRRSEHTERDCFKNFEAISIPSGGTVKGRNERGFRLLKILSDGLSIGAVKIQSPTPRQSRLRGLILLPIQGKDSSDHLTKFTLECGRSETHSPFYKATERLRFGVKMGKLFAA
ncbi:Phosphatidylinositide phosphatase SAC2 [Platysternon megacephalum]|uniref:Phosphatidylinositide phosphatase SAC2 n=1 Tax=Platysternon megacephalum TaxID=55544 RepID=A0A4D9ETL0_9SAUR|nr:Phosphatidylinositide phosphatase SAC2 [Platysternon megacephalum]